MIRKDIKKQIRTKWHYAVEIENKWIWYMVYRVRENDV